MWAIKFADRRRPDSNESFLLPTITYITNPNDTRASAVISNTVDGSNRADLNLTLHCENFLSGAVSRKIRCIILIKNCETDMLFIVADFLYIPVTFCVQLNDPRNNFIKDNFSSFFFVLGEYEYHDIRILRHYQVAIRPLIARCASRTHTRTCDSKVR